MIKSHHVHASDIRAFAQLAIDATVGLTDLVEAMHRNIAVTARITEPKQAAGAGGLTGLVYDAVRGVARVAGNATDAVLAQLVPFFDESSSSPEREAVRSALNGVLGDYMAETGSSLAIPMRFRRNGQVLDVTTSALRASLPQAGGRLVVLVHGLCMNDLQWLRQGHDHGAALAAELGYTPVYLHYNSGLHISTNGRAFAGQLQALVQQWPVPVEELAIIGHSMGGLVARSACYYGAAESHAWLQNLRKLVFLGTPHHGAPLERVGNWVEVILQATPYASPFARLGKIRSAGITDLRHGNLVDEDWEGRDRFVRAPDRRRIVPLPAGVACHALAGSLGRKASELLGDGLVPLDSALGRHRNPERSLAFAPDQQCVRAGAGHLDMLWRADVYAQIRDWLK